MAEMPSSDPRQIEAALEALDAAGDEASRRRVLDALAPSLRAEVDSLLAAEVAADRMGFLAAPPARLSSDLPADELQPGQRVGAYRLEAVIGRGGAGVVYRASRADDAFAQSVAIKVLRPTSGSRRFLAERQILAGLEHPGIARLLDGGTTDDGRPYLVMELVDGVPIDRWCRETNASVEERLELLWSVSRAVAYAHRRLIIHRDLKPSNILVTADGRPKLLDFGIAKLLERGDDPGLDTPPPTAPWQRLLTPGWASPEQVRGERLTAACDVYALGVLLFVLLTDLPPHPDVIAGASLEDMERALAEPAARPSDVVPAPRRRRLRGDLDVIVGAALHPDAERRYASAAHLADDLERHLEARPVLARPDSLGYRLGKLVRRHRVASLFAVLLAGAVLASSVALSVASVRLARERDEARAERDKSARLLQFMQDLFIEVDPWEPSEEPTVRGLLDAGRERSAAFADEPEVHAALLATLGRIELELGNGEEAVPLLENAVALQRARRPPEPLALAAALSDLGVARRYAERFDDAAALHEEALALRRSLDVADLVGESLGNLAVVRRQQGRLEEAIALGHDALAVRRGRSTTDPVDLSITWANLAVALTEADRRSEAATALDEALRLRRRHLPPDHPLLASAQSHRARLEMLAGDTDSAIAMLSEVLETYRRRLGPEHPETLRSEGNLAVIELRSGRAADAARRLRALEPRARAALGDDAPITRWIVTRALEAESVRDRERE
ncbi:MAG: serine/threonine-protein kinase [Acidobacteriota bacterium]